MSETVFWDTIAFVALSNADDALHRQAVEMSMELAQAKARMLTTEAVLIETVNLFSKRSWLQTAWGIVAAVRASAALGAATVVPADAGLWERGWQLHCSRPDRDWGLTDCISFAAMREHNIRRAFTADSHFEQAGFIRLLR